MYKVTVFLYYDKTLGMLYFFLSFWLHSGYATGIHGVTCAVDFIFLLNPNWYRKFLQTSWSKACLLQISSSFSYVEECFLHQNYLCKAFMRQFYCLPPLTCDDFALQYLLRRASLTAEDAFAFLKITTMMVTQFMDLLIHLRVFT